jgi:flagellar motor switch protein FliN/FliY
MAGDNEQVGQDEIEELLRQAQAAAGQVPAPKAAAPTPPPPAQNDQINIEALLKGNKPAAAAAAKPAAPTASAAVAPPPRSAPSAARGPAKHQTADDAEFLLAQAEQALASVEQPVDSAIANISPFQFPELAGSPASTERATLDLLRDVELDLRIELGRAEMYLEEVLKLRRGAVVTLDKLAGDPVDIYVNGRLVARGEVLVLNDNFCVRVAELLSGSEAA